MFLYAGTASVQKEIEAAVILGIGHIGIHVMHRKEAISRYNESSEG